MPTISIIAQTIIQTEALQFGIALLGAILLTGVNVENSLRSC